MIIDIYGLTIKCELESPELISETIRPFKYFVKDDGKSTVTVVVKEEEPPYGSFSSAEAKFSTSRNIVYKDKKRKIIDYFGKGAVVEDNTRDVYKIYSRDRNFLIEAFYLLILSLFGQFCDKNGILRIHALGLSYQGKAFLLVTPPGGGKSTMAFNMLREDGVKIISDDSPLFGGSGQILPFPSRLGILDENTIKAIPQEYVYKIDRMEFGPKYFIDYDYWKDKLEQKPLKDITLFVGKRILNGSPSIKRISKRKAFVCLFRDAVIGIGLYQGLEFIINNSMLEILSKIPIIFKRLILALKLTYASKAYQFTLSRDIAKNGRLFKEFIQRLS